MHALYEDLTLALASTPFAPHADQLAFQAIMHASAWLSADLPETPYYATDNQGQILYHKTYAQNSVPALDAHIAALWDGQNLTRAGLAVFDDLNDPTRRPCGTTRADATSLWLNHLTLLTHYGLSFDARLRNAHDHDAA